MVIFFLHFKPVREVKSLTKEDDEVSVVVLKPDESLLLLSDVRNYWNLRTVFSV